MIHLKGISVYDFELLILFITLRVNKKNIPCLCHFSCLELFQIIMRLEICKLVYHINCWLVDNINKCFFKCQIYKNMNIEVLYFYGNSTVCPPVANSPPRKFGHLFFGRNSGLNWRDFQQHLLLQQYKLKQRKYNRVYFSFKSYILLLILCSWNSLYAKNENYKT